MYFIKAIVSFIILAFWCLYANAQLRAGNYDALWKNVEQAVKKGLTKTALTEVKKIYALAKKEKQEAHLIKALIYQVSLNESTEENASESTISALTKELSSVGKPVASILNSILAEMYWSYFQQHRYQIYNRTQTSGYTNNNMATWTATAFHDTIGALYLSSLENKKLLQQTTLAPYEPILIKGNARYLRPTLYDLLAHRALDYFTNDERDINKPSYAFELKDDQYFAPADAFAKVNVVTRDSSSLHHKALKIFQELLLLHAGDARPDALIDADISRIQFVHRYGVMENKNTAYVNALQNITVRYPDEPAAAQAWFLQAQAYAEKASRYDPFKDTSNRFGYVRAKNICEKVLAQTTDSEGKSNCRALLQSLQLKQLNLQTEKVNLPGQPFRTLISFKNFTKAYFRLIPLTDDLRQQLRNRYDDAYWRRLAGLKFLRSWDQSLPATNDFQQHSAEIKIDAIPVGAYVLLASVNEDFSLAGNPMAVQYFHVSGISYVNDGDEYFVLHRESGRPLANAAVQTWISKYDYQSRQEQLLKAQQYNADMNGYFRLVLNQKNQENIRLDIRYKDDRLFLDDNQYTYNRVPEDAHVYINAEDYEKNNARVFLFTDRSIYRPGQTVYFKGIVITKAFTTRNNKVFSNRKTWVRLYNVNGEPTDSLAMTTNEFGSYSGKFTLPENGLNGSFRIADDAFKGDVSFSVEEYKRPRFYVAYEKLKGTYRVNDSIIVNGSAKAYAGNNIDGATVKYRVVREARFIYPWLYWKWGIPQGSNMEITNGMVITNASGEFSISFKAIPDLTVKKEFNPIFDYKVIADITDINGETRSNETIIPVSYKALQLNIGLSSGEIISIDSFKNIPVITQSLNGEFEPAKVHVTISRLQAPERLIRKRYWQQPDLFVLPEETFIKAFPHDEYVNETDYRNWAKAEKVYEATDSTRAGEKIGIRNTNFSAGWYVVEATTRDKYGEEVKDVQYIALHDDKSKKPLFQQYAWSTQKNGVIQPGETSTITIGSSAKDLFVIQQIEKLPNTGLLSGTDTLITGGQPSSYSFIALNNENKSFDFTATESDRGGYGIHHFFVSNNRFYRLGGQVSVPWTNKEFNISYGTFRDKTLPGSEEKWTLKISGYRNEKVVAEMLASMYDASLDQFRPHGWRVPPVWNSYSNQDAWKGYSNFAAVQSEEKYINDVTLPYFEKMYDRLTSVANRRNIRFQRSDMKQEEKYDLSLSEVVVTGARENTKLQTRNSEGNMPPAPATPLEFNMVTQKNSTVKNEFDPIQEFSTRKNFNETSFFFPNLKTDADGNIEFSFTMPEALTRWKFQALAYTKEAAFGYSTKEIVTQKQLMVQPNAPRFLREGDRMELSTKIANLTAKELTGTVQLELLDAATMQPVDGWFQNMTANQYFTAEAGKSVSANFSIQIPYQYNSAILYRFIAKAATGNKVEAISDGEEDILPVLTNSMLVTESMPLPVKGNTVKNFRFEKLLQSGTSETLQHHALSVEFTSNPAWYVVQSLPYLFEVNYENAEQVFNRYYANALAVKISNSAPRIKDIFEKWKNAVPGGKDDSTLFSNLQKNQELKSVLMQETPWVLEAKSETQQKKNLALLFDSFTMGKTLEASLQMLKQYQSANGGFVWCKGGPDDRYFTQYILTGLGRLQKMKALPPSSQAEINSIVIKAIPYLNKRLEEDYKNLIRYKADLKKNNIGYLQIQYLYLRSFFKANDGDEQAVAALTYYRKQSQQYWLQQNEFMQGMIALYLHRTGDNTTSKKITESLKQNAIINEETGMYWKDNRSGYFWHHAPVETQSLLIEAFSEINGDLTIINDLKTWLLKQKQTQHWNTSKATADACYALLLQGADWLKASPVVDIKLGDKMVTSNDGKQDAGTGYFDKSFTGAFVNPSMGNISVQIHPDHLPAENKEKAAGPAWGAVYWQYFEKLDKITPAATPLRLVKKLFVERSNDRGPELHPVNDGDALKVGDKIKVRIELVVDRDLEYVHMKDMRASAMEPVNVLSAYKWQGGLGYYETTKDAGTSFFFNWLPKGTYVFEYPLFVTQAGEFSNGITSIQCLYAPDFASHSEGIRVRIE